jgi:hypothetical protein
VRLHLQGRVTRLLRALVDFGGSRCCTRVLRLQPIGAEGVVCKLLPLLQKLPSLRRVIVDGMLFTYESMRALRQGLPADVTVVHSALDISSSVV